MSRLARALRHWPFALMWTGQTVSILGDRVFQVALAQGVFRRTCLRRYLTVNPNTTADQVRDWVLPVAAARLHEHIENEEGRLRALIEATLQEAQSS